MSADKQKYHFDKQTLLDLYITQKKSTREVARLLNTNKTTIKRHLKIHEIKVRSHRDYLDEVGFSQAHKDNMSKSRRGIVGENCAAWKGGKTKTYQLIRGMPEYKEWRTSCFQRDNYTCQICNKRGGVLNVDHINPLCILIREFDIKGTVDARNCQNIWDLNNGRTLCESCHKKTPTFAGEVFKKIKEWEKRNT